jgi:hypothetical protein
MQWGVAMEFINQVALQPRFINNFWFLLSLKINHSNGFFNVENERQL